MKIVWYAGVNEYGYIFPLTLRDNLQDCIDATCKYLGKTEDEMYHMGIQIIEYLADGFLANYPLSVAVDKDAKMTPVRGYRVKFKEILTCKHCGLKNEGYVKEGVHICTFCGYPINGEKT